MQMALACGRRRVVCGGTHQAGGRAVGGLKRGVAIGAEAEAERRRCGIVIARFQAPGGALRQQAGEMAEGERGAVVAQAAHRAGDAVRPGQELHFSGFGGEAEVAQEAGLRRRQPVKQRGEIRRPDGIQRARVVVAYRLRNPWCYLSRAARGEVEAAPVVRAWVALI